MSESDDPIFKQLIDNIPFQETFAKVRQYCSSEILACLTSGEYDFREFFCYYYSQVGDLKVNLSDAFYLVNVGVCETVLQIIKSLDISNLKSDEFFTAFQLFLCSHLSDLLTSLSINLYEPIFLTLGLIVDFLRKTKNFCPELFFGVGKFLEHINQNFAELDDKETIIKWMTFILNSMFILIANDPNLDVLIKRITRNLEEILPKISNPGKYKNEFEAIVDKLRTASREARLKSHLSIGKDKPLMKIKQLTPRIIEQKKKGRQQIEEIPAKQRIKNLKSQLKVNSKKIRKQLLEENALTTQEKIVKEDHIKTKKEKNYKRFLKIMEEQTKEIKKMETTQLQHKKRENKTKKRRLAGNRVTE